MNSNINQVLANANQQLNFIQDAIEDLEKNKTDQRIRKRAWANIVIFGRSVTFVLQNLRSKVGEQEFNKWYEPIQEKMKTDELLCAFKNARNSLEKQGAITTSTSMHIDYLDSNMMRRMMGTPPKNAKSFFIGDTFGGSGWFVEMPDGTEEKVYVDIGENSNFSIQVFFSENPTYHNNKKIENPTIENCSRLYYRFLKNLVQAAEEKFKN